MENGKNIEDILRKSTAPDRRRAIRYIRNISLGVLLIGALVLGIFSMVRSADTMVDRYTPVTGARG